MEASAFSRRWLWRILAIALLLRLTAAVVLQLYLDHQNPPRLYLIPGDAEGYWDLAGDLAAGRPYEVYVPPRQVLRMPGFPALLAISRFFFGDQLLPARLLLAGIGAFACWGVWRLAVELVDETTALLAAALAALSPVMAAFSPLVLSETAFAAALLVNLVVLARLLKAHHADRPPPSGLMAAASGLTVAIATYVRPSWLLAGPMFGCVLVALASRRRIACRDAVILNAALLVALVPWGLRNRAVTGHFVLTTLWMGPSLYDGLSPTATGDSDMAFFDRDNLLGAGLSEYQVNAHYRNAALDFARNHPGRVLQLAAIKLWRYWKPWPNAEQFHHPAAMFAVAAWFAPLLVLALLGAWRRRTDRCLLLLAAGPILYLSAVHLVFVSSLRYRLPAEYPLLVLSASGLRSLLPERWLSRPLPTPTPGED